MFWALSDVSFDVHAGSSTALIGGNGAGKSTLLRVAAGLTYLTRGSLDAPLDIVSVLNLGATFDGTLSGSENALTGLIVNGMSRRAAHAELPSVREFAELEGFFDSPVRTYSAGMTLRLAFAVTTRLRARVLLVDEVLSVGDLRFQDKCVHHLRGLCASGATILMATHDLKQAAALCDQTVWLQAGRVRKVGPSDEVIAAYEDAMHSRTLEVTPPPVGTGRSNGLELRRNRFGSQELRIEDVTLNGGPEAQIQPGGLVQLEGRLVAAAEPKEVVLGITIWRAGDQLELVKSHAELGAVRGDLRVSVAIERLDLGPGEYFVDIGAYNTDWSVAYDYHWGTHRLKVAGGARQQDGTLEPPMWWRITDAGEPA